MSLIIDTFEDLVHIVETHPEWRRRLKRALFDIDIEASTRALEKAVAELISVQARVWPAIERLLAEQSKQSADIAVLKTDVAVLKTDMAETKQRVTRMGRDLADVKGKSYEHDYRLKANAIFGRFIRRGRDRTDDMADLMHDAVAAGQISEKELAQVLAADLLWGGKTRRDDKEVVVVLEVSWRAEIPDVERAHQRAATLRRLGIFALPVVAGTEWDEQALALASSLAVATASNGTVDGDSWRNAVGR